MTFVRPARRVLIAGASLSALLAVAACGGGGDEGSPASLWSASAGADFSKQGDIEVWHGKDASGNFPKLVAAFNDQHPNGKVTSTSCPTAPTSSASR